MKYIWNMGYKYWLIFKIMLFIGEMLDYCIELSDSITTIESQNANIPGGLQNVNIISSELFYEE